MDETTALSAPPAVTIHPRGEVMAAVAEVLRGRLPGATVVPADGADVDLGSPAAAQADTTGQAGPRVVLVLLSADTADDEVRVALAAIIGQQRRPARVWLAVDARAGRPLLQALDDLLDEPDQPQVDAVVVLPAARPAAMALALEGWVRLRHDAPSNALVDLRDADGACRFAAIAAVAPTAPPSVGPAAVAPDEAPPGAGEHALLLVRRSLDEVERGARTAAGHHAARVLAASASPGPDALTPGPAEIAAEVVQRTADQIAPDDLAGLRAAQRACGEEATESLGPAIDAELPTAVLAVVQADTALQVESARSGLTAKIGRRKRIDLARSQRGRALQEWSTVYVEASARAARRAVAAQLVPVLSAAAEAAAQELAGRADDRRQRAMARWLTEAIATARTVTPPAEVDPAGLSRAWGRAAPAVRRYVVTPLEFSAAAAEPDVMLAHAPDAGGPIAVALVMGVPLRAFRVPDGARWRAGQARDSNMPMAAAKPNTERGS